MAFDEDCKSLQLSEETGLGDSLSLPNVPQEIIIEILLRLPVKSLVKFMCVAKSWLSLISCPQFAKSHLNFSLKENRGEHDALVLGCSKSHVILRSCYLDTLLFDIKSIDAFVVDDNYYKMSNRLCMIGSYNGLICLSVRTGGIFLSNPSIRKSKALPSSGSESGQFCLSLTYGFGYDELNNDYKVVETSGFVNRDFNYSAEVKMYSLCNNTWKQIGKWPGEFIVGPISVFVNGSFHWLTVCNGGCNCRWRIISLNLATDMYGELLLPKYEIGITAMSLGVLRDCLCVYYYYNTHLDIWMMKEYGNLESWTQLVCIMGVQNYKYETPMPLHMSENGLIILNFGSTLKLYNSRVDTSNCRDIFTANRRFEHKAITYIESLILPNSDNEGNQHWWQWGKKDDDWDFQNIE